MSRLYQPSITSPEQIRKDPLNTSPSQFQFSFPKSDRFPKITSYCNNIHYSQPQVQSKRSTSFGYGIKSDFTKTSVISPSPALYNKDSEFEKQRSISKGPTFGLSRDACDEYGYIPQHVLKNPGIGSYNQHIFIGNDSSQYTMRVKTKDPHRPVFLEGKRSFMQNPGPGAYNDVDLLNKQGQFQVARFRDSGAAIFNPPSSKRFQTEKYCPGPGDYQFQNGLDKEGKYVLSQYKGHGTRPLDKEIRKFFTDSAIQGSITPGPGNYRLPSNFGHYDHPDGSISTRSFRKTGRSFNNTDQSMQNTLKTN